MRRRLQQGTLYDERGKLPEAVLNELAEAALDAYERQHPPATP